MNIRQPTRARTDAPVAQHPSLLDRQMWRRQIYDVPLHCMSRESLCHYHSTACRTEHHQVQGSGSGRVILIPR